MVKITSQAARQRLADVPGDKQFWCNDGRILKNLEELATALEQMSDDVYRFHVNEVKSDFSNWVKDVIGEENLAKDLLKSVTRKQALISVNGRLKWLKEKVG